MGKASVSSIFGGVKAVKPAANLGAGKVTKLRQHLGTGEHISNETFKDSTLDVVSICEKNGVQVRVKKDGTTSAIWVTSRFLQPVVEHAQ